MRYVGHSIVHDFPRKDKMWRKNIVDELLFFKNSNHDNIIEPFFMSFEFGKKQLINEIGWQD